jgi:hypothetical protein
MRRTIINAIISLIVLLPLYSCGSFSRGIIVEKEYLPGRTLYANGVYNQTKARYRIVIENENGRSRPRRKKLFVSKRKYEIHAVGTEYIIK